MVSRTYWTLTLDARSAVSVMAATNLSSNIGKPGGRHKRPSIQQHRDLLIDKQYHHKVEVSKKQILKQHLNDEYEQQIREYLSEQYND